MTDYSAVNGVWQSIGYGWMLELDESRYRLLHSSANCLVESEFGPRKDFRYAFDRVQRQKDNLLLYSRGDITRYIFQRRDTLPSLPIYCPGEQHDPLCNFDYLWHQFHEHYAFFNLRGIDWDAVRDEIRPQLSNDMTEGRLLYLFERMLKPFNDGHVSLTTPIRTIHCGGAPALRYAMYRELVQDDLSDQCSVVDAIAAAIRRRVLAPLAQPRGTIETACNSNLLWCEIEPGIGYLCVLGLHGFADLKEFREIPGGKCKLSDYLERDMATLEKALDKVFTDLDGVRAMIIDLRINFGGFDRAAKILAGRFAPARRLAWQKRAVAEDGFTPIQKRYVTPRRPGFTGPAWVMTSPLCVSAGEVLTLCMRRLPQVTTVGESTAGTLSDNLIKPLPNGWELSLSNEIYEDASGRCFEGTGIPPHRPSPVVHTGRFIERLRLSLKQLIEEVR